MPRAVPLGSSREREISVRPSPWGPLARSRRMAAARSIDWMRPGIAVLPFSSTAMSYARCYYAVGGTSQIRDGLGDRASRFLHVPVGDVQACDEPHQITRNQGPDSVAVGV